jgi:carboxypeptidase C (cathepsin A)
MDHLGLDPKLRDHVEHRYFEAGHMMYLQPSSLAKFKAEVAGFIERNDRL